MKSWKHTGFHVDASRTVAPENRAEREQLCQYVLRNPFSVEPTKSPRPKVGDILGKPFEFPVSAFAPLSDEELQEWGL